MDQLARDAIAAQKEGMSYGKYMATKHQPAPAVLQKKKTGKKKTDAVSERPRCKLCGELIPEGSKNRKYCSYECAERAREQQSAEYKRRKRQEKKGEERQ